MIPAKIPHFKLLIVLTVLVCNTSICEAQKRKLIYGSLQGLKNERSFAVSFTYDSMIIGVDMPERKYLEQKKNDWEEREPGKGSAFVKQWFGDRVDYYEPTFVKNFEKYSGKKLNDPNAKYMILLKTKQTEGGWTVGVVGHPGEIDGEMWVVETANPSHVIAKIAFINFYGNKSSGGDFEMTNRIEAAYAFTGKWMGDFIRKKSK